jgi:hypothetical protein
LGDGERNIYLKVTSARATGSAAVVSDAFRLIVDPRYEREGFKGSRRTNR